MRQTAGDTCTRRHMHMHMRAMFVAVRGSWMDMIMTVESVESRSQHISRNCEALFLSTCTVFDVTKDFNLS